MHLDMNVLTCPFSKKKEWLTFNLDYYLFVLLTKKEYSWLINYRPPSLEHRLIFIIPGQSNNYLPQCQKKNRQQLFTSKKKSKLLKIPTNIVPPPLHFLSFSAVKVHESCEHTRYTLLGIAHILLVTNILFSNYGIFQKPSKSISLIPTLVRLSRPHSV